ncbi:MAG: nucleotidyltransferase family protein [Gammaproteobacteria bacterium]|nr:nucleotidyltransferase family protein [Pseudomonadales bacterium]
MSLRVGAIVLAAGFSSRFGAVKLCASLQSGRTVLQQTLDNIQAAVAEVLVITRDDLQPLLGVPEQLAVTCPDAENGMGTTLAFGMRAAMDRYTWDGCLICLADMPFISQDTYRQVAGALNPDTIVIPQYQERAGNPVAFGSNFFPSLTHLSGDRGGRDLLRQHAHAIIRLDLQDPAILQDIDTPEDLTRHQQQQRERYQG